MTEHNPLTPVGNTGVKLTEGKIEILIDWLQGTFPQDNFSKVLQVLESALEDQFAEQKYGTRFYERSWRSACGSVLAASPKMGGKVEHRTDAYLEMAGHVVGRLSPNRLHTLMRSLGALGFKASRIDCTLDDFGKSYTPGQWEQAYDDGNVCGFKGTGNYHRSGKPGARAETFSLGKRGKVGGGKYLVCYDKSKESNGERDCIRTELSFYGQLARQAFDNLSMVEVEDWLKLIPAYIFGAVDFRDKTVSPRADRCPRLQWWEEFVNNRQGFKLSREKVKITYERAVRWLQKQVAPTLALVAEILIDKEDTAGWNTFLWDLIGEGERRRSDIQWTIFHQATQGRYAA